MNEVSSEKLVNVMSNLCKMLMDDGNVPEDVIEMMIDAGADVEVLKKIGFTDSQIKDYAYRGSTLSGRTQEEVLAELYGGQRNETTPRLCKWYILVHS